MQHKCVHEVLHICQCKRIAYTSELDSAFDVFVYFAGFLTDAKLVSRLSYTSQSMRGFFV